VLSKTRLMKKLVVFICMTAATGSLAQSIPTAETQIKIALLAAPEEAKDKAMVYGYSPKGDFIVLRKGEGELVCLTDDPAQNGINVSCYHKSLEPFMARGRELKKDGKSFQEVFEIRESEVKAGKLKMNTAPATLVVFTADKYDEQTGQVTNGYSRSVIYIPYATAESTGLPAKPGAPGMPWIMNPGTHRAHIMIDPPKK
jgi:hypothetical protein